MQAPDMRSDPQGGKVESISAGARASASASAHALEPGVESEADRRLQRTMKFVVAALGFLLVAGLVLVVVRVIYLASKPAAQGRPQVETAAPPVAAALQPEQLLELPAGAEVRSVSISGDRLAVHYEAGGVSGIAILDLASGRRLSNVTVTRPAAP